MTFNPPPPPPSQYASKERRLENLENIMGVECQAVATLKHSVSSFYQAWRVCSPPWFKLVGQDLKKILTEMSWVEVVWGKMRMFRKALKFALRSEVHVRIQ